MSAHTTYSIPIACNVKQYIIRIHTFLEEAIVMCVYYAVAAIAAVAPLQNPSRSENHSTRNPYEFFIHNNHIKPCCLLADISTA